jgi:spore coat polysaccharide biosynthesis protein SpsF (cytidylyltransferase family)
MIPVFLAFRRASERLKGKYMAPLEGLPLIEWMVQRANHFGFKPHIVCPKGDEAALGDITSCLDVFGGFPDNVETLCVEAAHHWDLDIFHQLDGDDPFFSRESVMGSMQLMLTKGLFSRILPSVASQSGSGLMGTSYNLKAHSSARIETYPDEPGPWPLRLTLDYEEDYHLLATVARILGYMAPRHAVDELFFKNPDLHKVNWFRTAEWKRRQNHERSDRLRESIRPQNGG